MIILSNDLDGDRCQNNYGLFPGAPATRFSKSDLMGAVEIFDIADYPMSGDDHGSMSWYSTRVYIKQLTLENHLKISELNAKVCPAEQMLLMVDLKMKCNLWKTPV